MPRVKPKPENNGTLPHSADDEAGALGTILYEPGEPARRRLAEVQARGGVQLFSDDRNVFVFRSLARVKTIDFNTVRNDLEKHGLLEQAGGWQRIATLPNSCPSPENLTAYLDVLAEKATLRRFIMACREVEHRALHFQGEIEEFVYASASDLQSVLSDDSERLGTIYSPSDLDRFEVDKDPNCLIGRRWLCRAGKVMLVAPSGHGKSTLTAQMAISWALGKPFCSIGPRQPLSSVIIGDENDQGDLAEMFQGVRDGMGINSFEHSREFKQLDGNLKFFHWPAQTGDRFLAAVENYFLRHPVDIAWLDPLVSYADVDITKQDGAAKFLRRGLSRISERTGVAWIVIHHTPKPQRESKFTRRISDYQYAGAGSYDLSGWARAVMTLDESEGGVYKLILSKRGERSGSCHPDGTPSKVLWLRRADGRVCWEQIEPPEESAPESRKSSEKKKSIIEQVAALNMHEILSTIPDDGESAASLGQRFQVFAIENGVKIGLTKCRTDLLYLLGSKQRGMLRLEAKSQKWFKGSNA